jgi:homoserine kinase type II
MKQSYSNDNFKNIQESYQQLYNFKTLNSTLINRGWLNLKWKIDTDQGVFLVKQYHRDRFKGLESLKFALFQQQRLHDLGVPCPKLLMNQEEIIHLTASGEHFIIMDFCEGEMLRPGKLNKLQIYDLGRVIGKIHRHLNDGSLGTKSTAQFVLPSRESRITHWNSLMEEATLNNKLHLLPTIEQQLRVTETLDINAFHTFKQGWAHRDLWVDNLLFNEDTLSAVLDFDRLNYDYLNLDVARAI